jgi:hypothetical protein
MADPILWTPGQVVAGPDTDTLAAQHGGVKSQQVRTPTKEERQRYEDAGIDLDANPITRYYFGDGTYAELMLAPNNADFTVVDYKPSAKFTQEHSPTATSRTQATIGRVEGTPLPGGGFDNSKPIWVERDASGQQVGSAKPLTQQQREQWEREKNGGLTDQEIRDRNSPEARVGKPTGNVRTRSENGATTKESEYLLPDGTREWRSQTETTQPDRIGKPTGNTRQRNENGQVIKESEYILPDGTREWRSQTVPDAGIVKVPEGAPPIDRSSPQAAFDSFQQLYAWVDQQVRSGKMSTGDGKSVLEGPHQAVTMILDREKAQRDEAQRATSNALTQRAQDTTLDANRLSNATTGLSTAIGHAEKTNLLADPGTNAAASTLLGELALQGIHARAMGGLGQYPSVVPGPVANMGTYPGSARPSAPASVGGGPSAIAPVAAGVTATNAAAINPTGANVQAANDATMQGSGAAFGALGVPAPASTPPAPIFTPQPPVSMTPPGFGVPTMALASTFSGQPSYDPAVTSMRALGFSDEAIQQAMRDHVMGGAA